MAEASEWVELHYTNAQVWVKRFLGAGVAGLLDRPKSGRPCLYGADLTTEILKVATARPKELGLNFTTWSLPKLQQYLHDRPGLEQVTRSTIRRRLREGGLGFRAGPTWGHSKDPEFEAKKTKS